MVSAMTGVAVSISGVIGFVGIVVPHLLRLVIGPAHRLLLPASVLLGAILMVGADTLARTIVAPAEMPIGILTAAVGAPVFLGILLRQRGLASYERRDRGARLSQGAGRATLLDGVDLTSRPARWSRSSARTAPAINTAALLSGDLRPTEGASR